MVTKILLYQDPVADNLCLFHCPAMTYLILSPASFLPQFQILQVPAQKMKPHQVVRIPSFELFMILKTLVGFNHFGRFGLQHLRI